MSPQAQKVASQLKRDGAPGDDDAPDAGAGKFVWHKKIEKQILDGAKVKDLTIEAERKRHRERQVRGAARATSTYVVCNTCHLPGGD